jgi:dihydroorotate dehydrogenase electron transfer subunit
VPLAAQCRERGIHTEVVLGAQRAEMLLARDSLIAYVGETGLHSSTDDGSAGRKGLSCDLMRELLEAEDFDYIATCGPEPMQRRVVELAAAAGIACEVSLERRMACGIGACLSCAVTTRAGTRRACVDGPVFDAEELLW